MFATEFGMGAKLVRLSGRQAAKALACAPREKASVNRATGSTRSTSTISIASAQYESRKASARCRAWLKRAGALPRLVGGRSRDNSPCLRSASNCGALNRVFALEAVIPKSRFLASREQVVAYSPLCRGFLTYDSNASRTQPPMTSDPARRVSRVVTSSRNLADRSDQTIADEIRCTPAQLVIAWVIVSGDAIVSIPGTKWPLVP